MQQIIDKLIAELYLIKKGAAPELSYDMHGELYLSKSGWILLSVPNSLVRGSFDALGVVGAELPPGPDGKLNAHISVIRPEELEQIGGADKVTERGKQFRYRIKSLKTVVPSGWPEISKVWMLEVQSPELENLRKSYGLSAKPKDNKYEFHITIAVRRKHVLKENEIVKKSGVIKVANSDNAPYRERAEVFAISPSNKVFGGMWDNDKTFAIPGGGIDSGEDIAEGALREFNEETGLKIRNPRLVPDIEPVVNIWPEEYRKSAPEDRKHFLGGRTHYVLADIDDNLLVDPSADYWGAKDKRYYDLEEALKIHTGSETPPMSKPHWEARKRILENLLKGIQSKKADNLPGGEADNTTDDEFDKDSLEEGIKHELEHTDDKDTAKEIAKDHLKEDPEYYTNLDKMHEYVNSLEDDSEDDLKGSIVIKQTTMIISSKKGVKPPKELEKIFSKSAPGIPEELEELFNRGR